MNKFCQLQRLKGQWGLDCAVKKKEEIKPGVKFQLATNTYDEILNFCQKLVPQLCNCRDLPHPKGARVLYDYAKEILSAKCAAGRRISKHEPNDVIEYISNGKTCYGQVCEIVELAGGANSILIKVVKEREVPWSDSLNIYFQKLNVLHVQLQTQDYIHLLQVVMPVAYCLLPA